MRLKVMMAPHPEAVGTEQILSHAYGLAALADERYLNRPVSTCGDWRLADLVWHLAVVQSFWSYVIDRRPHGPAEYSRPARPVDNALSLGLREAADGLAHSLNGVSPSEPVWSWSAEQTVGFTVRRQTHEALIHHVDGLLACERPLTFLVGLEGDSWLTARHGG